MLGFGKIEKEEDLFFKKDLIDAEYRKLPIDTKYFSQDFKERLIEKLTENADLDDLLDGLLIKSENWQALNLLLGKYKEKVQTIYIDPPFNKEQDADYLYNVKYKDSTWASTLENRLRLARDILDEKGSIFVRCDYNGNWIVRPLMDEIFGRENFRNELTLRKVNYQGTNIPERFNPAYDLLYFYSNGERIVFRRVFKERNREIRWVNAISPKENKEANVIVINGRKFTAPQNNHWRFSQEKFDALNSEGRIRINEEYDYIDVFGKKQKGMPQYLESQLTPLDSNWTDISGYSFGWNFPTENSEILLKRIIESTSNEGDLVMDFFLGSGTTTAVAQKLGRKWIGIEMGEHFWSVIMPRMKRVLAYDKSGISKENDVKERYNENNAGGFFKYQILEQYEDTLDNIELTENKQVELKLGDDYLLKYFLDFETRESPYLLNMDHLKNPFSYKLKVNLEEVGEPQEMIVDIPETFNYLLGLKIKKIKVRNNQRKYLFILGEKEGKDIAIVWREYKENWDEDDFKKDKEFIIQELKPWRPHIVYVNGQSVLTSKLGDNIVEIRYIEPEFKRLMG